MLKLKGGKLSRRGMFGLAAAAAAAGPFLAFRERARAGQKTLKIAKWAHFLPEYDTWFENVLAREWGERHDTQVTVDHIPVEKVHAAAAAEVAAGHGHDLFMFPWPPAEFQRHVIDHAEIYQRVAFKVGSINRFAQLSTFDPKEKRYFAFADFWIPAPLHYFADQWSEVGMHLGPVHYGGLRSGARQIRAARGIPCGLALTPTLEGNVTLHTLLFAFRSRIVDPAGNVVIAKDARTLEALKYVKALYEEAGTPDEIAWGPSGNADAMRSRRTSSTVNAISLLRMAEKENPEAAKAIRLSPPLVGSAGVLAFPHATNCSAVWSFAQNPDGAKAFLADLVSSSKAGYEQSGGCNFAIFQKAIPNLIRRLENDPQADPPYKYKELKDALYWTRNLGFPGYANPVAMEVFNSFVIPRMFMRVVKNELSPEDAARAAEAEVSGIAARWRQV